MKPVFYFTLFVFTLVIFGYFIVSEQNDLFQTYQKDDKEFLSNVEKTESEISEKILNNNITKELLTNPQASGIILLDYFNNIIQEIAAESSFYDLIGFSIGMVIYGIFVYHFYRFLSKRDMFSTNIEKRITQAKFQSTGKKVSAAPRVIGFIATNFFIFPFVIFLWFVGYSSFMFMLVQNMPTSTIFLVSSGLIIAIRISAYYSEDLSRDIAKLLPFALLGIFLFNPQFYSFSDMFSRLFEIPSFIIQIASFMVLVMAVEIALSTLYIIKIRFFHKEREMESDDRKAAV